MQNFQFLCRILNTRIVQHIELRLLVKQWRENMDLLQFYALPPVLDGTGIERVQTTKLKVLFSTVVSVILRMLMIFKVLHSTKFSAYTIAGPGDATSTIICNLPDNNIESYYLGLCYPRMGSIRKCWPLAELKIWASLKRSWRYGFITSICDVQALLDSVMHDLFVKMQNPDHCLYQLLPPQRSTTNLLRERGHNFELY